MTLPEHSPPLLPASDRLVFVGGLHRSGTTPITRWLADHPQVSGFADTGAWEDEGQHLQDVIPTAQEHGGPGRFAFDPEAWLTEQSPLATPVAAARMLAAWTPHWDTSRRLLLEKSPPNLVRLRFLRACFPAARFVVVVRHPLAVALATRKWSRTGIDSLLRHWVLAHGRLLDDARQVGQLALVRYEDVMGEPGLQMTRLFSSLGLEAHDASWPARSGLNDRYLDRSGASWRRPWGGLSARRWAARYEISVAPFGYSLVEPSLLSEPEAQLRALRPGS